ncbi:uncharacterized protein CANTADRAFT_6764 [Suhomyces tanzawaensis NRRL Y-17324]|uniref:tRNA-splicing endonuclease subunit Sen2 n=1 Tax=Suhomyces tanzawaensis NRRL Y-17324 TaxID=984487 RepID=A0A1E4SG37_9ASCO|nr:uncharacterized protein CANTADRAFT_6764 [Suhomyces tanzawaensis NRRL Y-17324]ODV78372.1 hypothetical protein CANTADRAFT_6764 [Suhomyces tanzawaensis NRRL Y-17324]
MKGGKTSRKVLNELYARPLPLVLSSEAYNVTIPNVFPHNPISWIYLVWKIVQINTLNRVPQSQIPALTVQLEESIFKVADEADFITLWRCGFFGKGVLSRSEPTWKERSIKRFNTVQNDKQFSMEELTKKRRDERKKFKAERAKLQELELKQRKEELSSEDAASLEGLKILLSKMRMNPSIKNISTDDLKVETEESELADIIDLEYLQLQAIETFYLKFALNVINVYESHLLSTLQLFDRCCRLSQGEGPNNTFIIEYSVYHYFRSLGWCVRSGIKFGCDMLLYKRGPPFTHAEFAVMIIPGDEKLCRDWFDMAAIARVIGTVKKTLVLAFVEYPNRETYDQILLSEFEDEKEKFTQLLGKYRVTEILYRRWAPGRTRD